MLRANIYSLAELDKSTLARVKTGVDLALQPMHETAAFNQYLVRLPRDEKGKVNAHRVGTLSLDHMVELHLMVVPLDRYESVPGRAFPGAGVLFVDNTPETKSLFNVDMVVAHHVSHALGFVRRGSLQREIGDPRHCCSKSCVMHSGRLSESELFANLFASDKSPLRPTDFCSPCKKDIETYGEEHLGSLRMRRLREGRVAALPPAV